ncbi:PIPO, partial [Ryegrass mosaic virus]|uniref:PIPO n=1 Tax=Ryegrass mosaic virus TaxID=40666 RepID=UPI000264F5BC
RAILRRSHKGILQRVVTTGKNIRIACVHWISARHYATICEREKDQFRDCIEHLYTSIFSHYRPWDFYSVERWAERKNLANCSWRQLLQNNDFARNQVVHP